MSTRGQEVRLTAKQREDLRRLQRRSSTDARTGRRARIIELLGQGRLQCEVAEATGAGIATVGRTRRRFLEQGFKAAVFAFKQPGAQRLLDAADEAKVVALACTDPPLGRARWTVALLAREVVRRGHLKRVGRETIRLVLKCHGIKPWREKNVVCGGLDPRVQTEDGGHPAPLQKAS
jgi:putative transposase